MPKLRIKNQNSSKSGSSEKTKSTDVSERPEISIHFEAGPPILKPLVEDDKREGPRFKANFEVTLIYESITFRTKLVNMSMVGVLLQEPIPETLIKKPISLMIVHNMNGKRETLLLKAEALGAPLRSPRIRFTSLPPAEKQKLESLFKKLPPA